MKNVDFREKIIHPTMDLEFYYNGKYGSICPFAINDISVTYDGETKDYDNVDDVMGDAFFDEKSLNEICESLEL